MNLYAAIRKVLSENQSLCMDDTEDRLALSKALYTGLNAAMFGEGAKLGEPDADRALEDLFGRCQEWTAGGSSCEPTALNIQTTAVELAPEAGYLALEELDNGDRHWVLGYDLPDADTYYFHRFPEDAKVFVLEAGAVLITHPDLELTAGGLDEGDSRAYEPDDLVEGAGEDGWDDDDEDEHDDDDDYDGEE